MGRKRKAADPSDNDIRKAEFVKHPSKAVEQRLFGHLICSACNARNDQRADKCRKCGHKKLRPKNNTFADE